MCGYLMGIDIGTSGCKCLLCDEKGQVVASELREYPLYTPQPGWAEQTPEDWWVAVREGAKSLMAKVASAPILGISFSGQMHGLVALDADNQVIRPSILWCDQRTQAQCDEITEKAGGLQALVSKTNNRMLTGYTGGKILWLQQKEPEKYARMVKFVCPKDYVRFRMTGVLATDVSDASGTGFFNVKERVWNKGLIEACGLDMNVFPMVLESTDEAGCVTAAAAEETGIPAGIKVYAGGGDAVIQSTGAGLIRPGTAGMVIGTAGNISMGLDAYCDNPDGKLQLFAGNDKGFYQAIGCTQTAGGAYRWYRDVLCEHDIARAEAEGKSVYDIMGQAAAASKPGSRGVTFLPYLTGERCPYPDPNARGTFFGLSLMTERSDITRSVMEGVTFSLRQVIDIMRTFADCKQIYLSGGGAKSPLWRQMTADICQMPVYTTTSAGEGGAFGAVLVAGVGCGVFSGLNEAVSCIEMDTETLPTEANKAAYEDAYGVYSMLYHCLKPAFDAQAERETRA